MSEITEVTMFKASDGSIHAHRESAQEREDAILDLELETEIVRSVVKSWNPPERHYTYVVVPRNWPAGAEVVLTLKEKQ